MPNYKFYPPARSHQQIYEWYAAAVRRGAQFAEDICAGNFCHHVGRRPTGAWTLYPAETKTIDGVLTTTKVVWIPMSIYYDRAYGHEELLAYIAEHQHELPFHPWEYKSEDSAANLQYVHRYFNAKLARANPPSSFTSVEHLLSIVGPRPGPEWRLTTNVYPTRRQKAEAPILLSESNFLWITDESIKLAKQGILAPPQFPDESNRTETDQIINDTRFAAYTEGVIKYAKDLQANQAWREEKETQLQQLLSKMEDFLISKGYQRHDALNPLILPDHQKLQKGRQLAQDLMVAISQGPAHARRKETIKRLNEANKQHRIAERQRLLAERQTTQIVRAANHVPNPKGRGRPFKRFVKRKVKIATLTPNQKHQLGIPVDQDYIRIRTENTGRWARRTWVEMEVLNPALAQCADNGTVV